MDSLPLVAPRKKNPWTSTSEILLWILFVALIFPVAFAGYAVGHYTSLGKPPTTVTVTVGSTSTSTPTTTAATTTSSGGDPVAAGKVVFNGVGTCATCHTFAAAGSSGTIGPNLDNQLASDAAADNMPLAAFIKESIVNPNAYIAKNFTKPSAMPPNFGTSLTPTQIDDLVAFLSSTQH